MSQRTIASANRARPSPPGHPALVAIVWLVVHWFALGWFAVGSAALAQKAATRASDALAVTLPSPVALMREMLLAAVAEGHIEALREVVQWNELPPYSGDSIERDPIAAWRARSGDGTGGRVLRVLEVLLGHDLAVVVDTARGPRRFVWPAFAERPPERWTAEEEVSLAAIASADEIAAMRRKGRYVGWRLVIGEDGTWHAFEWLDDAVSVQR